MSHYERSKPMPCWLSFVARECPSVFFTLEGSSSGSDTLSGCFFSTQPWSWLSHLLMGSPSCAFRSSCFCCCHLASSLISVLFWVLHSLSFVDLVYSCTFRLDLLFFFASVVIMKHYTPNDLLYFPLSLFSDPVDSCVNRPSAVRIWPICVVLCGSLPLCFAFCFYGLAIVICHPHLQSRLRFGFHCTSNDLFAPFSVSLFSDLVDLYVNWPLHLCIGPICLNTHVYIRFGNVFLSSCNNISLLRIWFFIRCPLCISGTGWCELFYAIF
jgi:hypothetical protein